jgi:hypothetical protein
MRAGEEAKDKEQEELREERGAMARAARGLERKRQERRVLNAKVKTAHSPPIGFIGRGRALRSARPARINCSWNIPSLTNGPTTTAAATQPPAGHHHGAVTEGPWQAVTSASPLHPLRARPQRLKRRARGVRLQSRLQALNGPVPYYVRKTLEWPEPLAQINTTLEGCKHRPVALKPV